LTTRLNMNWINKILTIFWIGVTSIGLLLLIDFLIGGFLLPCSERVNLGVSKCTNKMRVAHNIYHHDFSKNGQDIEKWGNEYYTLCTDGNGFKISCNTINKSIKNFDIAFIGDSFTEGIGLSYEDTFVGQIAKSRPELKIANLGVSSYSPSIYFSKVNFLLEQGITFNELVVYIDISDIQDEAISYELTDGVVVSEKNSVKKLAQWAFPLTYYGFKRLKTLYFLTQKEKYIIREDPRGAWTYNPTSLGYGEVGVKGGIEQSLIAMTKLSELLRDRGINLSVGVYPWPSQLLYDTVQSEQVRIWEDFCRNRCISFYNSFKSFFALKDKISANKTIELYFISGDVHHNRKGAEVIADDFLNSTKK
jgi:hypothetical protein